MTQLRILFGVDAPKLSHVNEFANILSKNKIECKVVIDSDIYDGFPNRKISSWFQTAKHANRLFKEFNPDLVFVDRHGHFAKAVVDARLPLLTHLRGDYWSEMQWYKETLGRTPIKRIGRYIKSQMEEKLFQDTSAILPICNYLDNIVKKRYPKKKSFTLYQGINPDKWDPGNTFNTEHKLCEMNISHPCVGLLQSANIWGKAREMLILSKVIKELPEIMFYWAGDGPYRNEILSTLSKYDNFKWLGALGYPHQVKKYLAEIDIYALISGIDMSPLTLQEAQLMEKPVLATRVGGIPEIMQDGTSGILVDAQNPDKIIKGIHTLTNDEKSAKEMGKTGRKFVSKNFNWNKIAVDFLDITKSVMN